MPVEGEEVMIGALGPVVAPPLPLMGVIVVVVSSLLIIPLLSLGTVVVVGGATTRLVSTGLAWR